MYKLIVLALIIADFLISSCGRYSMYKYHIGKSFSFQTKKEFVSYAEKQTGFNADNIYYASENGYINLVNEIEKYSREGNLWGFYTGNQTYHLMDSTELKNLYCKQNIQNLTSIFFSEGKLPGPYLTDSAIIESLHLKNLSNNRNLLWSDYSGKRLIILQYATAFGSYYKDLFTKIAATNLNETKSGNIIILCLDPVFQLP